MYLLSRLHRYAGIGRFGSLVTRCALSNGSAAFFTQTFRVSFHGLRNAMYCPSGEICAPAISGLPKKSSRSIRGAEGARGARCARGAVTGAACTTPATPREHTNSVVRMIVVNGMPRSRKSVVATMPDDTASCPARRHLLTHLTHLTHLAHPTHPTHPDSVLRARRCRLALGVEQDDVPEIQCLQAGFHL